MPPSFVRNLNLLITAALIMFLSGAFVLASQWIGSSGGWIESKFFPASKDHTFVNWVLDEETHTWSADFYMNKQRPECLPVKGQIIALIGKLPRGTTARSSVSFTGKDGTTNLGGTMNRVLGWQKIEKRFNIDNPDFVIGTIARGTIYYDCHEGSLTVTEFGPFVVGEDGVFPSYATVDEGSGS